MTGDSFGPMTGQLLTDFFRLPTAVYGTLNSPVHALNLTEVLEEIEFCHSGRKILAIDSALSEIHPKNTLCLSLGPIRPGLATGKELPAVGDFSITAVIGKSNTSDLYSANTATVYRLSLRAANVIGSAFGVNAMSNGKRADLMTL